MKSAPHSFIISSFREFFQLLVLEKARALSSDFSGGAASKVDGVSSEGEADQASSKSPAPLFSSIAERFQDLFETQSQLSRQQGGVVLESYYKRAQYIMVALADETFINLNWGEQDLWERNLLETKNFNTHQAGTEIFKQIDLILKETGKGEREIAELLLWILGDGFEGRYRNAANKAPLQKYKEDLYRFITSEKPVSIEYSPRKVCPHAYQEAEGKSVRYLSSPRLYILGILAVLAIYFGLSIFVWNQETEPLKKNMSLIAQLSNNEKD